MSKRASFLLRLDPRVLAALRKWSEDEMRSINGQIEYILRQNLAKAGRLSKPDDPADSAGDRASATDQE